jgi:hypothetical protein
MVIPNPAGTVAVFEANVYKAELLCLKAGYRA